MYYYFRNCLVNIENSIKAGGIGADTLIFQIVVYYETQCPTLHRSERKLCTRNVLPENIP